LPLGHDHRPDSNGRINCPVCNAAREDKLEPKKFGLLYFKHAAPLWLKEHKEGIGPKMLRDYGYMLNPLLMFFGDFPLNEIHIGHVQCYVDMRLQMPRKVTTSQQRELPGVEVLNFNALVGPNSVRKEISMLSQIMDRGGLWEPIKVDYKPPKLPKKKLENKVPEDEDLARVFMVACSNARWRVAYWGSMLQISTCSARGEVCHLHLNDIDLAKRTMRIRDGLKNEHRDRVAELNENAFWALGHILKRYYRICRMLKVQPDPEHYILPGRTLNSGHPYDLNKPMGSWRTAWDQLREKAGMPDLQMRHMRHIALTRLLENPEISERTIIESAGHVSKQEWKDYSSIRRRPKQEAMKTLEFPRPRPIVQTVEDVDIAAESAPNSPQINEQKKG
jgi:integrase